MVKREHVAWVLLMASFILLGVAAVAGRGQVMARLRSNSRAALLEEAARLENARDSAGAARIYAALARQYPEREDVLLAYAQHLDRQGQYDAAEEAYRRAATRGYQYHKSVARYMAFLDRQGRSGEADAFCRQYVAAYPNDLSAQLELGVRLVNARDFDAAEPRLLAAVASPDLRFRALVPLAHAYAQRDRKSTAIDTWLDIVALDNTLEKQLYWQDIARTYGELGDWSKAVEAWKQYVAYFPASLLGAERLADAYAKAGRAAESAQMALLLQALTPPVALSARLSDRVTVAGVSELSGSSVKTGDVFFRFDGTVSQPEQCEVRFRLAQASEPVSGDSRLLQAQPSRLGYPLLWRGDSLERRFAFSVPPELPPDRYRVTVEAGPEYAQRVPLWEFDVPPTDEGKAGK